MSILTSALWQAHQPEAQLRGTYSEISFHDLKHIASKLKNDANAQEYVADLTVSLSAYEHTISTGNDTVDMILTEQALKFNQSSIVFTCIADGGILSFMCSIDMISLFSNALDNAYEAVLLLGQESREVYLTVKCALGMISISIENPCFTNGLPVTSKRDQKYHGFGMKSIRSIVEKYGDDMNVSMYLLRAIGSG